jgi:transglutaminase-like putative cysteine protease
MKKIFTTILLLLSLFTPTFIRAADYDFHIENNMEIKYEKGNKYVTVKIEYIREVLNNDYYFPANGEKKFFIPDLLSQTSEQISSEREFKKESIKVTNSAGKNIDFTVDEGDQGIEVTVPNYKETTSTSPYKIFVIYNSHDYVEVVNENIVIQAPSLPEDTQLELNDEDTETVSDLEYNLDIVVDKEVGKLAKIWPTEYTLDESEEFNTYSFSAPSRIGKNPYIEFGLSQIYRFELEYTTPKTDSLIPENYPEILQNISKNILELSLPRYVEETEQTVKIDNISPTPDKILIDEEGNIIATFEVDANRESTVSVSGYVWVEQPAYSERNEIPNPTIEEYSELIESDEKLLKYLDNTKYWQVNDPYIQEEATKIKNEQSNVLELIEADYQYINEKLEYDQSKADTINDRIGAKQALQGEASVCMEYADAMISILRAQGIASRAVIGYSNLSELVDTPENQVRHQWVQVWIPEYGWLSVDPTWESENMDIGPNIKKLFWETFNGEDLSNTKIYSADSLDNTNGIEFNISVYAVRESEIEDIQSLKTYEEIVPITEKSDDGDAKDWFNKVIKASSIGKSIAILIPVFVVIAALIVVIGIFRALVRKLKSKKREPKR